jgi:hemerythrin-like domain-containing protein
MNQTSAALHDEHRANIGLLGQVEHALARAPRGVAAHNAGLLELMRSLLRQVEQDVDRHFAFEERELFPRLEDSGEGDIAGLLREEHDAIRDVVDELRPLAGRALEHALDDPGWNALRTAALELVERQVSHIQKEEMALLPMLDDLLDDETDRRLAMDYAST